MNSSRNREEYGQEGSDRRFRSGGPCRSILLRLSGTVSRLRRMEEAGGLLRYAIPMYRLPRDIVRRTITMLENIGLNLS